jgi:S1-C subfamily serine protease
MFNMAGEVIGVVSHILTQSGGFEGLGFALSINTAREILLNQSAFWTGVEFYPLAGPLARALNISQGCGLLVQRVALNAPARRLGIRPGTIPVTVGGDDFFIGGDVVVSMNGIAVNPADAGRMHAIRQAVNRLPTGGIIEIVVIRDGKTVTLSTAK